MLSAACRKGKLNKYIYIKSKYGHSILRDTMSWRQHAGPTIF